MRNSYTVTAIREDLGVRVILTRARNARAAQTYAERFRGDAKIVIGPGRQTRVHDIQVEESKR